MAEGFVTLVEEVKWVDWLEAMRNIPVMTEAERQRRRIRRLLEKVEKAAQEERSKLDSTQLPKKDCEEDLSLIHI
eukprot:2270624-Alexandrium_andersonii.AAC.1